MSATFTRTVEDFTCEHCGAEVVGDGYTNHCPTCLWSKHVDVSPGDRAAACGGMMEPIEIMQNGRDFLVLHKCVACSYIKKNKLARNDDMEVVVTIARHNAHGKS